MNVNVYYDNYSPVGDLVVVSICFVFIILIVTAYINQTKNFQIFTKMVALLVVAALSNVIYHYIFGNPAVPLILIYLCRIVYHLALFGDLYLYIFYILELLHQEKKDNKGILLLASIALILIWGYDILGTLFQFGFQIVDDDAVQEGLNIFPIGYVFFVGLIFYLFIKYRNLVFKQILYGLMATCVVSFMILAIQGYHKQSSFTTATFLFPAIAILYLIHSNPYDISIGAVNVSGFQDMIQYNYRRGRKLLLISLYMTDFEGEGVQYPQQLQDSVRQLASTYFRGAVLFRVSSGHIILVADITKTPNYESMTDHMLNEFIAEYRKYRNDYKIVITESVDVISEENEYVELIRYTHERMKESTIYRLEMEDVEGYHKRRYVLKELKDIYKKKDLDDERVLVYCQPVYNIATEQYDTAEALMRLKLPESGMVFPDQFIPLAEENNYIHVLSLIILHKTCMQISKMLTGGYLVNRISVNISVLELRDNDFCEDISRVISNSGIPKDKIAIEITESQDEKDFLIMKTKINELRESGIQFYLDDFGTGYSNIERIMELPFDIIKFDRSLVMASGSDEKSERMVGSLAQMFDKMDYSVLYEGVETQQDEEKCINMSAKYLQGYKYSKPIPIEDLTKFFSKQE